MGPKPFLDPSYGGIFSIFLLLLLSSFLVQISNSSTPSEFQIVNLSGSNCVVTEAQRFFDTRTGVTFISNSSIYSKTGASEGILSQSFTLDMSSALRAKSGPGVLHDLWTDDSWLLADSFGKPVYTASAVISQIIKIDKNTGSPVTGSNQILSSSIAPTSINYGDILLASGYKRGMVIWNNSGLDQCVSIQFPTGLVNSENCSTGGLEFKQCGTGPFSYGILETVSITPSRFQFLAFSSTPGRITRTDLETGSKTSLVAPSSLDICAMDISLTTNQVYFTSTGSVLSTTLSLMFELSSGLCSLEGPVFFSEPTTQQFQLTSWNETKLSCFETASNAGALHGPIFSAATPNNQVYVHQQYGLLTSNATSIEDIVSPRTSIGLPVAIVTDYATGDLWCLADPDKICIRGPEGSIQYMVRLNVLSKNFDETTDYFSFGATPISWSGVLMLAFSSFDQAFFMFDTGSIGYHITSFSSPNVSTIPIATSTFFNLLRICFPENPVVNGIMTYRPAIEFLIPSIVGISSISFSGIVNNVYPAPGLEICSFNFGDTSNYFYYHNNFSSVHQIHEGNAIYATSPTFWYETSLSFTNLNNLDLNSLVGLGWGPILAYGNTLQKQGVLGKSGAMSIIASTLTPAFNPIALGDIIVTDLSTNIPYALLDPAGVPLVASTAPQQVEGFQKFDPEYGNALLSGTAIYFSLGLIPVPISCWELLVLNGYGHFALVFPLTGNLYIISFATGNVTTISTSFSSFVSPRCCSGSPTPWSTGVLEVTSTGYSAVYPSSSNLLERYDFTTSLSSPISLPMDPGPFCSFIIDTTLNRWYFGFPATGTNWVYESYSGHLLAACDAMINIGPPSPSTSLSTSPSASVTQTRSRSATPIPSPTITPTSTVTSTASLTSSNTPTASFAPSTTPSPSRTPFPSPSPSFSLSSSITLTVTVSSTITSTLSRTVTPLGSSTVTPTTSITSTFSLSNAASSSFSISVSPGLGSSSFPSTSISVSQQVVVLSNPPSISSNAGSSLTPTHSLPFNSQIVDPSPSESTPKPTPTEERTPSFRPTSSPADEEPVDDGSGGEIDVIKCPPELPYGCKGKCVNSLSLCTENDQPACIKPEDCSSQPLPDSDIIEVDVTLTNQNKTIKIPIIGENGEFVGWVKIPPNVFENGTVIRVSSFKGPNPEEEQDGCGRKNDDVETVSAIYSLEAFQPSGKDSKFRGSLTMAHYVVLPDGVSPRDTCMAFNPGTEGSNWKCEDQSVKYRRISNNTYLVKQDFDHFTGFSVLLGDPNGGGGGCDFGVLQWLSVAFLIAAGVTIVIVCLIHYYLARKNQLDVLDTLQKLAHNDP